MMDLELPSFLSSSFRALLAPRISRGHFFSQLNNGCKLKDYFRVCIRFCERAREFLFLNNIPFVSNLCSSIVTYVVSLSSITETLLSLRENLNFIRTMYVEIVTNGVTFLVLEKVFSSK